MTDQIKQVSPDPAITQIARKQTTQTREAGEAMEQKGIQETKLRDGDLLQVDQQARDQAILEENARLLLDELPAVRPDKVEEAKRKLQQGFYDRPEVLQKTAENLQQDLFTTIKVGERMVSPQDASAQHVKTARHRLAQGYYEQQEVLKETADRIVKKNL